MTRRKRPECVTFDILHCEIDVSRFGFFLLTENLNLEDHENNDKSAPSSRSRDEESVTLARTAAAAAAAQLRIFVASSNNNNPIFPTFQAGFQGQRQTCFFLVRISFSSINSIITLVPCIANIPVCSDSLLWNSSPYLKKENRFRRRERERV